MDTLYVEVPIKGFWIGLALGDVEWCIQLQNPLFSYFVGAKFMVILPIHYCDFPHGCEFYVQL
jgi:hypothetical protein